MATMQQYLGDDDDDDDGDGDGDGDDDNGDDDDDGYDDDGDLWSRIAAALLSPVAPNGARFT